MTKNQKWKMGGTNIKKKCFKIAGFLYIFFPKTGVQNIVLVLVPQIKPQPISWRYPLIKSRCQHWFLPKDKSIIYQHQHRRKNWCKRAIFSQESENSVKNKNVESCRVNSSLLSLSHVHYVCNLPIIEIICLYHFLIRISKQTFFRCGLETFWIWRKDVGVRGTCGAVPPVLDFGR